MKLRSFQTLAMLLLSLTVVTSVIGCSGGTTPATSESVTPPAAPTPKEMLLKVAETGEGGSGLDLIRSALEYQASEGDAKAEAAVSEVEQLMTLSDPEAIKKKAKEIADKL